MHQVRSKEWMAKRAASAAARVRTWQKRVEAGAAALESARTKALIFLLKEAVKEKNTLTQYMRIKKALDTLGCNPVQARDVLIHLEYLRADGSPYQWLERELLAQKERLRQSRRTFAKIHEEE